MRCLCISRVYFNQLILIYGILCFFTLLIKVFSIKIEDNIINPSPVILHLWNHDKKLLWGKPKRHLFF